MDVDVVSFVVQANIEAHLQHAIKPMNRFWYDDVKLELHGTQHLKDVTRESIDRCRYGGGDRTAVEEARLSLSEDDGQKLLTELSADMQQGDVLAKSFKQEICAAECQSENVVFGNVELRHAVDDLADLGGELEEWVLGVDGLGEAALRERHGGSVNDEAVAVGGFALILMSYSGAVGSIVD